MSCNRIFSIIVLLLFIWNSSWVSALTNEQKWQILDNFKREEYELIFESDASIIANEDIGILSTARKINIYNSIWESIRSKRAYLEFQSRKVLSRVSSLEDSIKELDESIADVLEEVNKINLEVIETKNQIDIQTKTINLLKKKIESNTQVLLEYITYMYKRGDSLSEGGDIDTIKTILLSWEDVAKVVDDLHYNGVIQLTGQRLLDNHRNFVSTLYVKQIELKKDEKKLKQLRKSGLLEKRVLDDKKEAKNRLLEITKWKEELYQEYINDKLAIEQNIKIQELKEQIKLNNARDRLLGQHGCDFVDLSKSTVESRSLSDKCRDVNKIIFAESRLKEFDTTSNPFLWPINPTRWVSAHFRDEEYRKDFRADHDALDIVAPQGTEIRAPQDGYVVHIEEPTTNNYSYVAIKHANDLVTIYGHLNRIKVENFDFIKKWEVFALSGWEYGTKWAWVLTTGPHLHFWVYEDKEYTDPLRFLDISLLNYDNVPERYEFKYQEDFRKRKWYEFEATKKSTSWVFRIEWETEVERQKYLLNTYAVGPFRDWNIWVEESLDAGIDPTFVMCIGLAETTLWKYLKTPFNIWNVGNTDSWATKTFPNARSGVYAMAITLNNRFLGQYTEIQELSRYGNKDSSKPIYASSDYNWHNNITKCMSHIKWEFVPDDFKFRIQ